MAQTTKKTTAYQVMYRMKYRDKISMSRKNFMKIYSLFFERVMDRLARGERFQMGDLGSIYVGSSVCHKRFIDWGSTGRMWKEYPELKAKKQMVYFLGENIIYTFIWSRGRLNHFYPKRMYRLRACDAWRKRLSQEINENKAEYL